MNVVKILERAKEILDEKGWITGSLYQEGDGCCLLGAMVIASEQFNPQEINLFNHDNISDTAYLWMNGKYSYLFDSLIQCAENISGKTYSSPSSLMDFNDVHARSKKKVIQALDCAIEREKINESA